MIVECPLCLSKNTAQAITSADKRLFYQCPNCFLIFVDRLLLPTEENEKQRYEQHNNSYDDLDYTNFLNQAISPALQFIKTSHVGLDYGCGKNAVLSELLKRKDIQCYNFDPYYFPDLADRLYDFIFCTETAEHFFQPQHDFEIIFSKLKKGGYFVLMTEFWNNQINFSSWYYARDFTHVSFYHQNTLAYISKKFNLSIVFNDDKRVVIFIKN
jgi:hypothetical protein